MAYSKVTKKYSMFSSKSFIVLAPTFRSTIMLSSFLHMVWSWGPTSIFSLWISPHQFLEKTIFPYWIVSAPLLKSDDCKCKGLFLDSQLIYMSLYLSVPHCLDYYSFVVSFEIEKCECSNITLYQDCFGYFQSLAFHLDFRISLMCRESWYLERDCMNL